MPLLRSGRTVAGIRVIPIQGVLPSGLPRVFARLGFIAPETVLGWVREGRRDPAVSAILLDVHSPGGRVEGIQDGEFG